MIFTINALVFMSINHRIFPFMIEKNKLHYPYLIDRCFFIDINGFVVRSNEAHVVNKGRDEVVSIQKEIGSIQLCTIINILNLLGVDGKIVARVWVALCNHVVQPIFCKSEMSTG